MEPRANDFGALKLLVIGWGVLDFRGLLKVMGALEKTSSSRCHFGSLFGFWPYESGSGLPSTSWLLKNRAGDGVFSVIHFDKSSFKTSRSSLSRWTRSLSVTGLGLFRVVSGTTPRSAFGLRTQPLYRMVACSLNRRGAGSNAFLK